MLYQNKSTRSVGTWSKAIISKEQLPYSEYSANHPIKKAISGGAVFSLVCPAAGFEPVACRDRVIGRSAGKHFTPTAPWIFQVYVNLQKSSGDAAAQRLRGFFSIVPK